MPPTSLEVMLSERERLAGRIRELFDDAVLEGRSPNDAAAAAAERASQVSRALPVLPSTRSFFIALSYQILKFEASSLIKTFLSLEITIHRNCTNAKNPMIVMPMFIIMPMTSI